MSGPMLLALGAGSDRIVVTKATTEEQLKHLQDTIERFLSTPASAPATKSIEAPEALPTPRRETPMGDVSKQARDDLDSLRDTIMKSSPELTRSEATMAALATEAGQTAYAQIQGEAIATPAAPVVPVSKAIDEYDSVVEKIRKQFPELDEHSIRVKALSSPQGVALYNRMAEEG